MKRLLIVIPLLGVTAFAGYYHYWNSIHHGESIPCRLPRAAGVDDEYRHRNGKRDAASDIARGHPRILTYGLPVHWIGEYGEILKRNYGVELEAVAGCVVSTPLTDYVAAYNKTMEAHLISLHGPDLFDKASAEAEKLYAERHPR